MALKGKSNRLSDRVQGDYLIRFSDSLFPSGSKDAQGRPINYVARVYEMIDADTIEVGGAGRVRYRGDIRLHITSRDSFEEIRKRVQKGLLKFDEAQKSSPPLRGLLAAITIAKAISRSYEKAPA